MYDHYDISFTFNDDLLELWVPFSTWGGLDDSDSPLFKKIRSGDILTPNSASIEFWIEGIGNSEDFSLDSIIAKAELRNGSGRSFDDQSDYTVVEINAGVDGDRSSTIDFTNSYDRQLLFWYNHDREVWDDGYQQEDVVVSRPTSDAVRDQFINGTRDLEDFAPLALSLDELLLANTFDTSSLIGDRWGTSIFKRPLGDPFSACEN